MKRTVVGLAAGACMVVAWTVGARAERLSFDFEKNTQGWKTIRGVSTKTTVGQESSGAAGSEKALLVSFHVKKKKAAGIVKKVNGVEGEGVRVWLKTDVATTVVIGLAEKDGSAYYHPVQTEAGKWQKVEASFDEFTLGDDSHDENGRLDLDQVRVLVIADAAGFLAESEPGANRRLWVDDYAVVPALSARAGPAPMEQPASEPEVEGWTPIPPPAGANASIAVIGDPGNAAADGGKTLEIRFKVQKGKVAGIARAVDGLSGWGVRVRLKTDAPTVLVVGAIEVDGSSYHHVLRTSGGQWQEVEAPFESFTLSDDSKDENGHLDLDQVRSILIADAAGFLSAGGADRTVWVSRFEIVNAPKGR